MAAYRLRRCTEAILCAVRAHMARAAEQGQRNIPLNDNGVPSVDTAVFELAVAYMRHRARRLKARRVKAAREATCPDRTTTCAPADTSAIPPDRCTWTYDGPECHCAACRGERGIPLIPGPPCPGTADPETSAGMTPDQGPIPPPGGGG